MKLEGSCHCGAVRFRLESAHPYPYMLCYCSICRKTAGGGGYAINLSGEYGTLRVTGKASVAVYRAVMTREGTRRRSRRGITLIRGSSAAATFRSWRILPWVGY